MRLTAAEKYEVIRLVEGSDLSVRHTLRELQVPRATFYTWYRRYVEAGLDGLAPRPSAARRSWNRIPPRVRQRVVDAAMAANPETVDAPLRITNLPFVARTRPAGSTWHHLGGAGPEPCLGASTDQISEYHRQTALLHHGSLPFGFYRHWFPSLPDPPQ